MVRPGKDRATPSVQYLCNICQSIFRKAEEVKRDLALHFEFPFLKCLKCPDSPIMTHEQMLIHVRGKSIHIAFIFVCRHVCYNIRPCFFSITLSGVYFYILLLCQSTQSATLLIFQPQFLQHLIPELFLGPQSSAVSPWWLTGCLSSTCARMR